MAVALVWQSMLSAPTPVPPASRYHLNYPDTFVLRDEYLKGVVRKHYTVQPEDNLGLVLQKLDISPSLLEDWRQSCSDVQEVIQLLPGDEFTFQFRRQEAQPFKLMYAGANGSSYTFSRIGEQWECRNNEDQLITVGGTANGPIDDNLYDSAVRSGLPPALIMDLADLFACNIDFTSDLQNGDDFSVYFEQHVRDGKRIGAGPILAAEMQVGGQSYQAFRYELPDGYKDYFDFEGNSLKRLFLKAPLSFSRISSTFTNSRFHPVLKIFRPHFGIDYAAPTGTPVSALGDGVVTFIGNKGGFGRYIDIRHNAAYRTTYGHLSRFEKGLKVGSKVEQGQVIGYVGATGLATGPHLDFRFYEKGRPIDFLKTEFPHARSIPQSLRADFEKKLQVYLAKLQSKQLAQNMDPSLPDE
jgi:murein DD-endopeptidase MepM/ murein hydrolase activator NlpD